jgi:hypothetical protein
MAVAETVDRDAGREVQVALAVRAEKVRALAVRKDRRQAVIVVHKYIIHRSIQHETGRASQGTRQLAIKAPLIKYPYCDTMKDGRK